MRYISCFSGIGGLEASHAPVMFCEREPSVADVLRSRYADVEVWPDICTLHPPSVDLVAGGWPCQDLSIAGKQEGLAGLRSGLLRELLRVAVEAGAGVVVAENVTNLLRMRNGAEFAASLEEFKKHGFPCVGWRILNAREFGLPQNRSRLLIVAARETAVVNTLFREVVPSRPVVDAADSDIAAGFYWTAGTHSLNYTRGYVPTIKIGSSLGISSPPAVHYRDVVRALSADEALRLQGFDLDTTAFSSRAAAYKAAGNAVARDIGRWVLDGVVGLSGHAIPSVRPVQETLFPDIACEMRYPPAGIFSAGQVLAVNVARGPRASNLSDFLNLDSTERLSTRAAIGLLRRLNKSQMHCPASLRDALVALGSGADA